MDFSTKPDGSPLNVSRRGLLARCAAVAASVLSPFPTLADDAPPPETDKIRLVNGPFLCFAPIHLAEALLKLEGFSEIEYVPTEYTLPDTLAKKADLCLFGGPSILPAVDSGMPLVVIAGVHFGCWELYCQEHIESVRDLRGKRIAVGGMGAVEHIWLSSIFAYVGIDPRTDVTWVSTGKMAESQRQFVAGEVDAFLAFPPQPQELRLAGVGRVLINITTDRPWSQYFCCIAGANRNYVTKYPVATKRALRALLKAADICAQEPDRAARFLGEKGVEKRYDIALEVLKSLPYERWRDTHPEDTIRFHALRLYEVGMIKTPPNEFVARATDWRFLNELRRELKA